MAPYVSASELTVILPQNVIISGSSIPLTLGEVGTIIAQVSAELDGAAAQNGYLVPLPPPASGGATEGYALMQRWTQMGAAAQILGIIFPNIGGPGSQNNLAAVYQQAYDDALKGLRGGWILPGAATDTTETNRELPRSFETSNSTATVGVLPHLDMDWEP